MRRRLTIQRQLVYDTVISLANHPTALEVHKKIIIIHPTISLATVYTNLKHLAEEGYIKLLSFSDTADRYDSIPDEHYHIKCQKCNNIVDLIMECPPFIDDKAAELSGYVIKSHDIIFGGICPECQMLKIERDDFNKTD